MSPMTGAEMAHIIKMRSPGTPVLMYTGAPPEDQSCLDVVVSKADSLAGAERHDCRKSLARSRRSHRLERGNSPILNAEKTGESVGNHYSLTKRVATSCMVFITNNLQT